MSEREIFDCFASIAGEDLLVSARELQSYLSKTGVTGFYQPFSLETCRLMMLVVDKNSNGVMEFDEFKEMWEIIKNAKKLFINADGDKSGTLDMTELQKMFTCLGYNLSPAAYERIMKRYGEKGRIAFDDFISCILKLRKLTDYFERNHKADHGRAILRYDDITMRV